MDQPELTKFLSRDTSQIFEGIFVLNTEFARGTNLKLG